MPDGPAPGGRGPLAGLLAILRGVQAQCWERGERVPVEDYLKRLPPQAGEEAAVELIYHEVVLRERHGESPQLDDYLRRFPQYAPRLERQFALHRLLEDDSLADLDDPTRDFLLVPSQPSLPSAVEPVRPPQAGPASPPAPSAVRAGWPDIPDYEFLHKLGAGGMSIIYLARHRSRRRVVAVKVLRPEAWARPEVLARFQHEAEALARLQHPHIVAIHAVGLHARRPFFELEYVEGGTLQHQLRGAPWLIPPAVRLVSVLARAVHFAHQKGIVHRDLKPANILLTNGGTPRITDFGLAKLVDTGAGQTRSDVILGTPGYMAPEQADGRSKHVGPGADVYALGAILYELLTGRPPFQAANVLQTLQMVVSREPVAPSRLRPDLPAGLDAVCLKCLEKEPRRRPASAEDLARELESLQLSAENVPG